MNRFIAFEKNSNNPFSSPQIEFESPVVEGSISEPISLKGNFQMKSFGSIVNKGFLERTYKTKQILKVENDINENHTKNGKNEKLDKNDKQEKIDEKINEKQEKNRKVEENETPYVEDEKNIFNFSEKDQKTDKFSQNSLNYLIEKKKQINKRNSETFDSNPPSISINMRVSCDLPINQSKPFQIFDEICEEDENFSKKKDKGFDFCKASHRKALPKPIVIENKSIFSAKKSPNSALDIKEPISPNRSILFFDFLKTKFGEQKFNQLIVIIEKYQADSVEAKKETIILKDDYEKMKEIIGESDAAYIVNFLRFILKLTPKGNSIMGEHQYKFDFSGKEQMNVGEQVINMKSPLKK